MVLYITVAGRVQGVGFRYFTRDVAKKLGLKGYVRNLPDGTVEIVAEGDEEKLRKLLEEVEKGPPLAEVTHIRYQFEDKEGGFKDFEIEY